MTSIAPGRLRLGICSLALLALVAAPAAPRPATAQTAETALSLEETVACVCMERKMERLRAEAQQRQSAWRQGQDELAALEVRIREHRATMDPRNMLAQEHMKYLIEQRDGLRQSLRREARYDYNTTVRELNETVAAYNDQCANRLMFKTVIAEAERTADCPE